MILNLLTRLLNAWAALAAAVLLFFPDTARGRVVMWVPRLLAESFSALNGLVGWLGVLLALRRRLRWSALFGLAGAGVFTRHIWRVTRPHDQFDRAFGPDWRARIPPDLRPRLARRRYQPLAARSSPQVAWRRNVEIARHPESGVPLLADVWTPPPGLAPSGLALIYFHGSGWHYFDKDLGTRYAFRRLAAQGHVALDVAYTLAPQASVLDMVTEVKQAIAWVKTHAAELGIDPHKVALMGASAGGQLSLLAAYTPNDPTLQPAGLTVDTSVCGVISYYGPPDLETLYENVRVRYANFLRGERTYERLLIRLWGLLLSQPYVPPAEWVARVLGGAPEEVPDLYFKASPLCYVGPDNPPTLLLQGAQDLTGMLPDVHRLHHALLAAGVPVVYVEYPNSDHMFDLAYARLSPAAQAAQYEVEHFLAVLAGGPPAAQEV